MKFKKMTAAAVAAATCMLAVSVGCSSDNYKTYRTDYYYTMGTFAYLAITADLNDDEANSRANALWTEIKSVLDTIENSISTSVSASYVNAFNNADAGEKIEVDETCYNILSAAVEVYNLTGGYYNPAVYYSVDLYGFATRLSSEAMPYDRDDCSEELPDEKYITAFKTLSEGFADIVLESSGGAYYVTKPSTTVEVEGVTYSLKIDLGGIGKGYAVDIASALIDEYGFEYGYFNFGSSSIAVKGSYDGENGNWDVSIRDPRGTIDDDYLSVPVADSCLSNSGDYEQYYEIDGVRYCHIIDPTTGSPVQTGVLTATVIGGTAAADDALTTAIMAMGLERAVEFINGNLANLQVAFVYQSGENYYVITNAPDSFTILSSNYTLGNTLDADGNIVINSNVYPSS